MTAAEQIRQAADRIDELRTTSRRTTRDVTRVAAALRNAHDTGRDAVEGDYTFAAEMVRGDLAAATRAFVAGMADTGTLWPQCTSITWALRHAANRLAKLKAAA